MNILHSLVTAGSIIKESLGKDKDLGGDGRNPVILELVRNNLRLTFLRVRYDRVKEDALINETDRLLINFYATLEGAYEEDKEAENRNYNFSQAEFYD